MLDRRKVGLADQQRGAAEVRGLSDMIEMVMADANRLDLLRLHADLGELRSQRFESVGAMAASPCGALSSAAGSPVSQIM